MNFFWLTDLDPIPDGKPRYELHARGFHLWSETGNVKNNKISQISRKFGIPGYLLQKICAFWVISHIIIFEGCIRNDMKNKICEGYSRRTLFLCFALYFPFWGPLGIFALISLLGAFDLSSINRGYKFLYSASIDRKYLLWTQPDVWSHH